MPLHVSSKRAHHQEVKIALELQFWPPDNEHMCSKHVEAWNKLIVKQKFCASSWVITEINILRCTVSKTSKNRSLCYAVVWQHIVGMVCVCSLCWVRSHSTQRTVHSWCVDHPRRRTNNRRDCATYKKNRHVEEFLENARKSGGSTT